MYTIKNFCLYCGKLVRGRSDKKFCDDYCRNSHNNHRRSVDSGEVRTILSILKTNQKILATVLRDGEEFAKVSFVRLCELGYNFKYHTHTNVCKHSLSYQFCFERGIYRINKDWVIVLRDLGDSYLSEFSSKLIREYPSSNQQNFA
ncbi:DUF2116 family Zn-ribbon domain-containing protein [Mongoliitalea daihaiensis]|uniref:DUF2116 family Zn-ribbon domain-containing protein n=1 Tax=Mongoliitalea daihaiensis TaxID=2782006 RepID=UPI001F34AACE|nr:DUF2116 family Zn-ribbon domain-containing protein [Mongoliitalea daihaiensis]UJP65141.1 DUF2116 family Zn-ribbon domain-containing protein [Mongoliitalea daihaiensis]